MKDLISIIVPVYNVEKYLKKCVESITNQTYKNIEILLIDDGSKDQSGELCDAIAGVDSRIIVFHKENGGLSDARNYGIKKAKGNFFVFVDSDDVISVDAVEKLYKLVCEKKAEIAICDLVHCFSETEINYRDSTKVEVYDSEKAICEMLYQKSFLVSACGKIFHRDCFCNIEFPVGMIYEDSAIMYKLFLNANTIVYCDKEVYGYMHREGSITTKSFSKKDMDILVICSNIVSDLSKRTKVLKKAAVCYQVVGALRIYLNAPRCDEFLQDIKNVKSIIRKNGRKLIFNKNVRRKTKLAVLLYYFARPLMPFIYKRINRWK